MNFLNTVTHDSCKLNHFAKNIQYTFETGMFYLLHNQFLEYRVTDKCANRVGVRYVLRDMVSVCKHCSKLCVPSSW